MGTNKGIEKKTPLSSITPDTIKLPHLDKPKWMGDVEDELDLASPPVVGQQGQVTILNHGEGWVGICFFTQDPPAPGNSGK